MDGRAWSRLSEESRMRVRMDREKIVKEKKDKAKEMVDKKVESKGHDREEIKLRKVKCEK